MALTANDILSSEMLLRVAISQLVPVVGFVFVVEALYRLVTQAEERHAWLMSTVVLIGVLAALLDKLIAIAG